MKLPAARSVVRGFARLAGAGHTAHGCTAASEGGRSEIADRDPTPAPWSAAALLAMLPAERPSSLLEGMADRVYIEEGQLPVHPMSVHDSPSLGREGLWDFIRGCLSELIGARPHQAGERPVQRRSGSIRGPDVDLCTAPSVDGGTVEN